MGSSSRFPGDLEMEQNHGAPLKGEEGINGNTKKDLEVPGGKQTPEHASQQR